MLRFELASDGAPDAPVPADDEVVLQLVDAPLHPLPPRRFTEVPLEDPLRDDRDRHEHEADADREQADREHDAGVVQGWTSRNPTVVSVMTDM